MKYRLLGQTGVRVSPLCLGTFNFGNPLPEADSIDIIHRTIDSGINFIDTADTYNEGKSERFVGKALVGGKRQRIVLATKCHFPLSDDPNDRGNSRRHILKAVEGSLQRLNTDWIDLYQLHRPVFDVPQDETLRALDDLVRQGKVRYIGSSTFPAWMVMESLATSKRYGLARFITEQPPYNLLDRRVENELVPLALRYNIGILPFSPLAMGVLAGRYSNAQEYPKNSRAALLGAQHARRVTAEGIEKGAKITPIANSLGLSPAQLSILWVKEQPAVTAPIIGPRNFDQLNELLAVMEMSLDQGIAAELDRIVPPGSAVADFHNTSGWMKMKLGSF